MTFNLSYLTQSPKSSANPESRVLLNRLTKVEDLEIEWHFVLLGKLGSVSYTYVWSFTLVACAYLLSLSAIRTTPLLVLLMGSHHFW